MEPSIYLESSDGEVDPTYLPTGGTGGGLGGKGSGGGVGIGGVGVGGDGRSGIGTLP